MPAAIRLGLTSHHRTGDSGGIGVTDFMAFAWSTYKYKSENY